MNADEHGSESVFLTRCHGLVPWSLTLVCYTTTKKLGRRCHGLVPWSLTLAATVRCYFALDRCPTHAYNPTTSQMNLYTYQPHEIKFAYCYRVYFSLRTYRRRSFPHLTKLQRAKLDALVRPYNIRVLECGTNNTDLRCILSLNPLENISSCASKVKGGRKERMLVIIGE
jgi:hypothetical protein